VKLYAGMAWLAAMGMWWTGYHDSVGAFLICFAVFVLTVGGLYRLHSKVESGRDVE
jgi:hypothetical protein